MKWHTLEIENKDLAKDLGIVQCSVCKKILATEYASGTYREMTIEVRLLVIEHNLQMLIEAFNNHTFK